MCNRKITKQNYWSLFNVISPSLVTYQRFYFQKKNQIKSKFQTENTNLSMLRIWLWRARKDTGESMASRLLAASRTTFIPVRCIFSVSWSTAMLDGAQTKTGPPVCFTRWYTMVAEVTVLPVPGGPWRNHTYNNTLIGGIHVFNEKLTNI